MKIKGLEIVNAIKNKVGIIIDLPQDKIKKALESGTEIFVTNDTRLLKAIKIMNDKVVIS